MSVKMPTAYVDCIVGGDLCGYYNGTDFSQMPVAPNAGPYGQDAIDLTTGFAIYRTSATQVRGTNEHICFWLKVFPNSSRGTAYLLNSGTTSTNTSYYIRITNNSWQTNMGDISALNIYIDGQWHWYDIRRSSGHYVEFYVDGIYRAGFTPSSSSSQYLGLSRIGGSGNLGYLAEFIYYANAYYQADINIQRDNLDYFVPQQPYYYMLSDNYGILDTDNDILYGFTDDEGTFGSIATDWSQLSAHDKLVTFWSQIHWGDVDVATLQANNIEHFKVLRISDNPKLRKFNLTLLRNHYVVKTPQPVSFRPWGKLQSLSMSISSGFKQSYAFILFAFSTDGSIWKYYNATLERWDSVDITSLVEFEEKGMDYSVIESMGVDEWTKLLGDSTSQTMYIAAYVNHTEADKYVWYEMYATCAHEEWTNDTNYKYSYTSPTTIRITFFEDGDYKVNIEDCRTEINIGG